jgi:hypothetical protein
MASYESLTREILPYVSGCPDSVVESNLRAAAIEFCEKTKAYTHDVDPITTISGVYEYDFDQPVGTSVHSILWMTHDGDDLDPISPRSLELNYPDWRDRSTKPQVYLQKSANTFWVIPIPNSKVVNGLQLSVALKPTRTTNNISTAFSNDYRDGIIFGTLYRLLRIPSRDWSDATAARDYLALFSDQVATAELRARSGDLGVRRMVKYKGVGSNSRNRYKRYGKEIDY